MVKASVFSILILCLALGTAAADSSFLDVIDSENLPPAAALRDETQWYRENRARIGRLGLDEAALPQEAELKNRLTRFLDLLTSQITRNQPNADLLSMPSTGTIFAVKLSTGSRKSRRVFPWITGPTGFLARSTPRVSFRWTP